MIDVQDDEDLILKPLKFKLTKLQNLNLRYEVIYKNLLRDLRKFYIEDFNLTTDYNKLKRRHGSLFYLDSLRTYI